MPGNNVLLERVEAALTGLPDVEQKKMFGGICFMVRGKMCITVRDGRIMCRIDPAIHDVAVARQGASTVVMKGRQYRGYIRVDAEAIRAKRDFDYWVGLVLAYNDATKSAARKKRP